MADDRAHVERATIIPLTSKTRFAVRVNESESLALALKQAAFLAEDQNISRDNQYILDVVFSVAFDLSTWYQCIAACIVDGKAPLCHDRPQIAKAVLKLKTLIAELSNWTNDEFAARVDRYVDDMQRSINSETRITVRCGESDITSSGLKTLASLSEDPNIIAAAYNLINCAFVIATQGNILLQMIILYVTTGTEMTEQDKYRYDKAVEKADLYADRMAEWYTRCCESD